MSLIVYMKKPNAEWNGKFMKWDTQQKYNSIIFLFDIDAKTHMYW